MTWLDQFSYRDVPAKRPHIYKSKILFGHWVCSMPFSEPAIAPSVVEAYLSWVRLNYDPTYKKV